VTAIEKASKIMLTFACVLIYSYSAIDISRGQLFSVSLDLSKPLSIVWPFEISIVGDMGEKGLRIAPKIGAGWRGKVGGEAAYRFYVPENGRYHIWAYCLWFDKCTNAVFAKIDNLGKAIIGNDPIYKRWHWVRGFAVKLKKGAHTLTLSNHSDHISIQKVLLMNSGIAVPDDCDLAFSDIFYDGFDGCHIGNFASWQVVSGEWVVLKPEEQTRYFENALVGKSEKCSLIIYKGDDWSNYSLSVATRSMPSEDAQAASGICFGVKDPYHYHQLKWQSIEGTDKVKMEVGKKADQETHVLADFEVSWPIDKWHKVEVRSSKRQITVEVDDKEQIEMSVDYDIAAGIGLLLEGKCFAYFDDIHVRTITYGENH
jgi:hypothetical protein